VPAKPARAQADPVPGPTVTFEAGPQDPTPTNDPAPTFRFSASDPTATFECSVDAAAPESCDSPYTAGSLADGPHRLDVRATDALGNPGEWAGRDFTVDTAAPTTTIDFGPGGSTPTGDSTPTFGFSSPDPDAMFRCAIDGGTFDPCESPFTTVPLGDGAHLLEVHAADPAGNIGADARRGFSVDSSVPAVIYTAGPDGPTGNRRPSFTFTSDPGSSFDCRLDGAAVGCAGGSFTPAADLADGSHVLEVRATNSAGTVGSWAPRAFTVDTVGPETVLVNPPPARTGSTNPAIGFTTDEAAATFECSIDGSPFAPCTSPWSPGPLAFGPHRVAVRALDALRNPDRTPATSEFTVAQDAPATTPTARTDTDAGVRTLAERLVLNLRTTVGRLRETELPTVLRRGSVRVGPISSLVPGTLTVTGRAAGVRGHPVVLRGAVSWTAPGSGTLALHPTKSGRALMRRSKSLRLLVDARFGTGGFVLTAAEKATLVRDWITPDEARRAATRTLRRSNGSGAKHPSIEIGARCGSGCLEVRAEWTSRGALWIARGRARQVDGRITAELAEAVRQTR
jgi:Bacterial Ig-like domain